MKTAFQSVKNSFITFYKFNLSRNSKYLHVAQKRAIEKLSILFRGGSRIDEKSKM